MNSCNANHTLIDPSLPRSTTSGSLVILRNSGTIPLPSSAIALPLPLGFYAFSSISSTGLALPSHHHMTPPCIFPAALRSKLYCLSNLFFPFLIYHLSSFLLSVLLSFLLAFPRFTRVSTGRGQRLMVIQPNLCLSQKRYWAQAEREAPPPS